MSLPIPVTLGSIVALPFLALLFPILVAPLLNEEKVLSQRLPGYDAYRQQTGSGSCLMSGEGLRPGLQIGKGSMCLRLRFSVWEHVSDGIL